jgi:hypothetical protein
LPTQPTKPARRSPRGKAALNYRAYPAPRPFNRADAIVSLIVGVAILALFFSLNAFYSVDGGLRITGPGANQEIKQGIQVIIDPQNVAPTSLRMAIDVEVSAIGDKYVNPDETLKTGVTVLVYKKTETDQIVIPAGGLPQSRTIAVPITGDYANYPLDRYQGEVFIRAKETSTGNPIPVDVTASDGIYNWITKVNLPAQPLVVQNPNLSPSGFIQISTQRSTTLIIFLGLVGFLVIVISLVAVFLAGMIFTFRRVANAALLAWMTTALFSFLVLRTALPGAPPLGAAIDVFLFFWAILGLMAAVVMVAIAWNRSQKALLLAEGAAQKQR